MKKIRLRHQIDTYDLISIPGIKDEKILDMLSSVGKKIYNEKIFDIKEHDLNSQDSVELEIIFYVMSENEIENILLKLRQIKRLVPSIVIPYIDDLKNDIFK